MHVHDHKRPERIGMPEAVLCSPKTPAQMEVIIGDLVAAGQPSLLTRLAPAAMAQLAGKTRAHLDYDEVSHTATIGGNQPRRPGSVAVAAAGTSDQQVAAEAARTLEFSGITVGQFLDIGVAGLWRLEARLEELRQADIVIAAAGMDAAMVSVLGGLIAAPLIAVPTSVGYGVATGGTTALHAALASCAQGVTVVNIDNGFGAACAAVRILNLARPTTS